MLVRQRCIGCRGYLAAHCWSVMVVCFSCTRKNWSVPKFGYSVIRRGAFFLHEFYRSYAISYLFRPALYGRTLPPFLPSQLLVLRLHARSWPILVGRHTVFSLIW